MDDGDESSSVRCRFVTAFAEIRVTSDPFSVPVRLGRKGLSDVSRPNITPSLMAPIYPFACLLEKKI